MNRTCINTNIIAPNNLPENQSGLISFVNIAGQVIACTATSNTSDGRHSPEKISRHYITAVQGDKTNYFTRSLNDNGLGMSKMKGYLFKKYPESWLRLTFTPMSHAKAKQQRDSVKSIIKEFAEQEGFVA